MHFTAQCPPHWQTIHNSIKELFMDTFNLHKIVFLYKKRIKNQQRKLGSEYGAFVICLWFGADVA